jgi:hypothetical protein
MVQGRYLFGGVAGVAVVVAFGWTRVLRRSTPLVALAVAVGAQVVALFTVLGYYWGEPRSSLAERLDAVEAWSPWPFAVNVAILVAVPLTLVPTVVAVARSCRRPRPTAATAVPAAPAPPGMPPDAPTGASHPPAPLAVSGSPAPAAVAATPALAPLA